jgi:hypothetical protein
MSSAAAASLVQGEDEVARWAQCRGKMKWVDERRRRRCARKTKKKEAAGRNFWLVAVCALQWDL